MLGLSQTAKGTPMTDARAKIYLDTVLNYSLFLIIYVQNLTPSVTSEVKKKINLSEIL